MKKYIFSMDIAERNDYSALEVYRISDVLTRPRHSSDPFERELKFLDMLEMHQWQNVPYEVQVSDVRKLLENPEYSPDPTRLGSNAYVVIDISGVGSAVQSLFNLAGIQTVGINFTGGSQSNPMYWGGASKFSNQLKGSMASLRGFNVPKEDLVKASVVMMEQGRVRTTLKAKQSPYMQLFRKQLMGFRGEINARGRLKAGNISDSLHDDLVCSFIMACWFFVDRLGCLRQVGHALSETGAPSDSYRFNPQDFI